jgi:hypothetical protein
MLCEPSSTVIFILQEEIMVQPAPAVSGGNPYIQAPSGVSASQPAGYFASQIEAFQTLFNDGNKFGALRLRDRITARVFRKRKWELKVDEAKRRVAGYLDAGKLPQAVRASYVLGNTFWKHFLIHHAETAYFYGAALSIGMGGLAVLNLGDESLRNELFAKMMAASVIEMQSAPEELDVGDEWPVFTRLLHGGRYDAKTQKYAGLMYVHREFRHDTQVEGSAGGNMVDTPISPELARKACYTETEALRKIRVAGIRVPPDLFLASQTAYVRTFVRGEPLKNLRYSASKLSAEQLIGAKAGYQLMLLKGVRNGLWKKEPPLLHKKAIFNIEADRPPESPDNWVVIEP